MTPEEENHYLVVGSQLFNRREFYNGHDEWEEVWRRAKGSRRRLLHGLIQVAVGYEHQKRGNPRGMRSLLRQGAAKLRFFTRRAGIRELRDRASRDAEKAGATGDSWRRVAPPKILVTLEGFEERRDAASATVTVCGGSRGSSHS